MPPKAARQVSAKAKGHDEQKEDPLQAVVLADTFEDRFDPLTLDRPRCLLPLANAPLIEYTLEFLASAGVLEVYFYAGAHVDEVEDYINHSRWTTSSSPFRKLALIRCAATSVGDVMRDLDGKHVLVGDFIVVSGDIVSDFPISLAMKKHKARREKDKNAIMTMLLRQVGTQHYAKRNTILPTFVIDPLKDRCLHYEETWSSHRSDLHIDPDILKTPEIDLRQDLIDCRIDICTPDVLSLWSDNFDNQSPRKDFLFGVLKDWELNGKTIHTYIVDQHYAARVSDLQAYDALSRDLMLGLIPSLVLQNNVMSSSRYKKLRGKAVSDRDVTIQRPYKIDEVSVIGTGTSIESHCVIEKSIIGQRCSIGKQVRLTSSYIWDDVTIGNNVRMLRAIVGSDASIGDDCTIGEGAIISFGAVVEAGSNVPAGAKIIKAATINGNGHVAGNGSLAEDRKSHETGDDDGEVAGFGLTSFVYKQPFLAESASTLASDVSEPSSPVNGSRSQSFGTTMSDDDPSDRFQHDTVAILVQRMQTDQNVDDMLSELMGLRFSGGADESQVRRAVAGALGKRISAQIEEGQPAANASKRTLGAYKNLIRRPQAEQTSQEQVDFLLDLQKDLSKRPEGGKALLFMAKDLYDIEIIDEESFLAWWSDGRSSSDPEMVAVREQTAPFIEWLKEADSESDEEEDD